MVQSLGVVVGIGVVEDVEQAAVGDVVEDADGELIVSFAIPTVDSVAYFVRVVAEVEGTHSIEEAVVEMVAVAVEILVVG
jgi:hypothetical protein